jgi:hypothetical protein
MERYFLDIPVYRIPEDRYASEMDAWVDAHLGSDAGTRSFYEKNPKRKDAREGHLRTTYQEICQLPGEC